MVEFCFDDEYYPDVLGNLLPSERYRAYCSLNNISSSATRKETFTMSVSKMQGKVMPFGMNVEQLCQRFADTPKVTEQHKELAEKFNGIAIPYQEMFKQAAQADIIITSTGAPHYVLTAENLGPLLNNRQARPLILIDIAVPRDVDPALNDMKGVTVYNIDDLENVVDVNKNFRSHEAKVAEQIIAEEIAALKERLRYYTMRPVMVQLHDKMNFLRQKVLKKAFIKLPNLTDEERRIIDLMTQRLEHKFLREPMKAMNAVAGTPEEEHYKQMMCDLFLLNESGEEFGDESRIEDWD